jgi:hypothetical protein
MMHYSMMLVMESVGASERSVDLLNWDLIVGMLHLPTSMQ